MSAAQLAGEQQPGLDRVEVGGQLAAERAVALLEPHRLDRVVARVDDAEVGAGHEQASYTAAAELRRRRRAPSRARRRR